jgi:hypothetical protein
VTDDEILLLARIRPATARDALDEADKAVDYWRWRTKGNRMALQAVQRVTVELHFVLNGALSLLRRRQP